MKYKFTYIASLLFIFLNVKMASWPLMVVIYGELESIEIMLNAGESYFSLYPFHFPVFLTLAVMSYFLYKQWHKRDVLEMYIYFIIGIPLLFTLLPKGMTSFSSDIFKYLAFHVVHSGIPYAVSILIGFAISYFFYCKHKSYTISDRKYTWLLIWTALLLIELTYLLSKESIENHFGLKSVHYYHRDNIFIFMENVLAKSSVMLVAVFFCSFFISLHKWSNLKHMAILALVPALFVIIYPTGDSLTTSQTMTYVLSYAGNYFLPMIIASLVGYLLAKSTGFHFSSNSESHKEQDGRDTLLLGKQAFLSGDYTVAIKYLRIAKINKELDAVGLSFYKQALERQHKI